MTNAEIQPRRITLSDGRTVPTFTGMHHTPEMIKHLKEVATGKPKPRESVENRSTVYPLVAPLGARGATVGEILDINPELERKQVRNALYRADRPQWHTVERDISPQAIKERRKRSHLGKSPLAEKKAPSQESVNSNALAKAFLEAGLITNDLSYWDRLKKIYENAGANAPESFSERIRLEVFLRALESGNDGDGNLMAQYMKLGAEIDSEWFQSSLADQENIIKTTASCIHHWIIGTPSKGESFGACKKCGKHKAFSEDSSGDRVGNYNGIGGNVTFIPQSLRASRIA